MHVSCHQQVNIGHKTPAATLPARRTVRGGRRAGRASPPVVPVAAMLLSDQQSACALVVARPRAARGPLTPPPAHRHWRHVHLRRRLLPLHGDDVLLRHDAPGHGECVSGACCGGCGRCWGAHRPPQLIFLGGIALIIGLQRTRNFFFQAERVKVR